MKLPVQTAEIAAEHINGRSYSTHDAKKLTIDYIVTTSLIVLVGTLENIRFSAMFRSIPMFRYGFPISVFIIPLSDTLIASLPLSD